MSKLRVALEEEARKFLRNQLANGTRKGIDLDPATLCVLGLIDTTGAFSADLEHHPVSQLLSYDSRFQFEKVIKLEQDLLWTLTTFATSKCAEPASLAKDVVDSLKNINLGRFLCDAIPIDLRTREVRLRAQLKKRRLKLRKSRVRNPRSPRYCQYDVIDERSGGIDILAPRSLKGLEQMVSSES